MYAFWFELTCVYRLVHKNMDVHIIYHIHYSVHEIHKIGYTADKVQIRVRIIIHNEALKQEAAPRLSIQFTQVTTMVVLNV